MKYLFIFILIIIVYIYFLSKCRNKENFDNNYCKKFYMDENRSIVEKDFSCAWDFRNKKCGCFMQKSEVPLNFYNYHKCCKKRCDKLSKEECHAETDKIPFWCPINNQCVKFYTNIYSKNLGGNRCGTDILNNEIIFPSLTKRECQLKINPCDKHNDTTISYNTNKKNCLNNPNCGWCTNEDYVGKCIEGTRSGPINIFKYNFCKKDNRSGKNSYTYRQ